MCQIPGALPWWIVCCVVKPVSVFFCPSNIQQRDILFEPPDLPLSGLAKKKAPERCDCANMQGQESKKCTSCWDKKRRVLAVQEGLSVFLFRMFISSLLFDIFSQATASNRFSTGLTANNYPSPSFEAPHALLYEVPHSLLSSGSQKFWLHFLLVLGLQSFPVSFYALHVSDNTGQIWMTLASVSNEISFSLRYWEESGIWDGIMRNAFIFCLSCTLDQAVLSHNYEFCPVSFWSHKLPSTLSWQGYIQPWHLITEI